MPIPPMNPKTAEEFAQAINQEIQGLRSIEGGFSRAQSETAVLRRYIDGLRSIVGHQANLNAHLLKRIAALEDKTDINP